MKHTYISLLFATVLCIGLPLANAHGLLCNPRQRAAYNEPRCPALATPIPVPEGVVTDYCPHCLNGGTVATVKKHIPAKSGWLEYDPMNNAGATARRASMCGDPFGEDAHMMGGHYMPYAVPPVTAAWNEGDTVDLQVEIDTNHNGFFEFFICDVANCGPDQKTRDISTACFERGTCRQLLRVRTEACEGGGEKMHTECGPVDPKYPGRWYVPCRRGDHVGVHVVGGKEGYMRYQLPKGFACEQCVLQWYWATANSCAPRGFLEYFEAFDRPFGDACESDGGGRGAFREGMAACGGDSLPEEFWSCADVRVLSRQGGGEKGEASSFPGTTPPPLVMQPAVTPPSRPSPIGEETRAPANRPAEPSPSPAAPRRKGACVPKDAACTGEPACCERGQVCVYSPSSRSFSCRYWWNMHDDAQESR